MKNNIMSIIGSLVFISLSVRLINKPDEYLALIKYDRQYWNNSGLNPTEYGMIFTSKEQEQKFFDQIDLTGIEGLQKFTGVMQK